jgi:hypothetical protein
LESSTVTIKEPQKCEERERYGKKDKERQRKTKKGKERERKIYEINTRYKKHISDRYKKTCTI